MLFLQIGENQLFHLSLQKFLLQQDIAGENKADEKRPHAAYNSRCYADGRAQHGICPYAEECHKLIQNFLPIQLCLYLVYVVHQLRMVGNKLLCLSYQHRHLFGQRFPKRSNGISQLRHNHNRHKAQ